jgi:cytochrome c553
VLGTVPVEEDGSAFFEVPSGVPVFFQALDAEGRSLQTMRSLTYVHRGERQACVGCHESRTSSPPVRQALPLASRRAPSKLSPPPQGSWPLRFDRLVQEVLDRHCVSCHKTEAEAAELDRSAGKAYTALLQYADGDLSDGVFERDYSEVGKSPSLHSKLLRYVRQDPLHRQLQLTHEDWLRIYTWMDTYGHVQGSFSQQQEEELIALRDRYRWLFTSDTRLDDYPQ